MLVDERRQQPGEHRRLDAVEPAEAQALGDEQVAFVEDVGEHLARRGQRPARGLVANEVDVPAPGEDVDDAVELPPERTLMTVDLAGEIGELAARGARPVRPRACRSRGRGRGPRGGCPGARRPPGAPLAPRGGRRSARARRLATSRR